MNMDRQIWQLWAQKLHRWGVKDEVAFLLEAAGPLSMLGAQFIYLGQPLLGRVVQESQLKALADLLEDPVQARSFTAYLREESFQ